MVLEVGVAGRNHNFHINRFCWGTRCAFSLREPSCFSHNKYSNNSRLTSTEVRMKRHCSGWDVTFYSSHLLHLHKPNPWCLRMANPEPLPQRATRKSRRLRGQEPVLESRRANGDNSTPSLHNFLTQKGH